MKQAEPQINIDTIVGFICSVCFALFVGYMIGLDHAKTEQELKAKYTRPVLPPKCACGLTEQGIRNIVYRAAKNCERKGERNGDV